MTSNKETITNFYTLITISLYKNCILVFTDIFIALFLASIKININQSVSKKLELIKKSKSFFEMSR